MIRVGHIELAGDLLTGTVHLAAGHRRVRLDAAALTAAAAACVAGTVPDVLAPLGVRVGQLRALAAALELAGGLARYRTAAARGDAA
ncbi:MAG: hypothetical protein ACK53A_12140 [Gemmatimonadota bacterium]|jgi:hypothetical protein